MPCDTDAPPSCSGSPAPVKLISSPRDVARFVKQRFCARQSRKVAGETPSRLPLGVHSNTETSCSGSENGNGRNRTALAMLKVVVVAAIPRATKKEAASANPGLLARVRAA